MAPDRSLQRSTPIPEAVSTRPRISEAESSVETSKASRVMSESSRRVRSLRPPRRCRPCRLGSSPSLIGRASLCRHSAAGCRFTFHWAGVVCVVVFSQQGSHFAQVLSRLLEHLDLLAQLSVLGLLLPQHLMNIFHTTPCGDSMKAAYLGSTVITAWVLPG